MSILFRFHGIVKEWNGLQGIARGGLTTDSGRQCVNTLFISVRCRCPGNRLHGAKRLGRELHSSRHIGLEMLLLPYIYALYFLFYMIYMIGTDSIVLETNIAGIFYTHYVSCLKSQKCYF